MGHSKWMTRSLGCLGVAAMLAVPAWGSTSSVSKTASPGTINYVEGQANIGNQTLGSKSVGTVELLPGQSLDTRKGRVEVLLTPGVFLRVGHDSAVTMVSPSLLNTKVKVASGNATVEVDELHRQNNLMVEQDGTTSYLVHTGFYDFDSQQGVMRVLKGQAVVLRNDRHIRVNGGHEVDLTPPSGLLKKRKFNKKAYKEDSSLYRWSELRSRYLAEANVNAAPTYYYNGWYGSGWWGPGWYWNPWFSCYTFIPGNGIFYSPFGWGFYSPWDAGMAPFAVAGGYYRDFGRDYDLGARGRPFAWHGNTRAFEDNHAFVAPHVDRDFGHGGFRGGFQPHGGFNGGGFRGGFHGGGFRGGFSGGVGGMRGGRR